LSKVCDGAESFVDQRTDLGFGFLYDFELSPYAVATNFSECVTKKVGAGSFSVYNCCAFLLLFNLVQPIR